MVEDTWLNDDDDDDDDDNDDVNVLICEDVGDYDGAMVLTVDTV